MKCAHLDDHKDAETDPKPQSTGGCQDCLAEGETDWVHLRLCLDCGRVGCCDSSPGKHASGHYRETSAAGKPHPVIRSFEPGESWTWCFVDEVVG